MKYLGIASVILGMIGLGYLYLGRSNPPSLSQPAPMTAAQQPDLITAPTRSTPLVAAEPLEQPAALQLSEDTVLEGLAAELREDLPEAIADNLTLTDAVFLPRMRILELVYVTSDPDLRSVAGNMRSMVSARAETVCQQGRAMFEMGVTLRNSFLDREGQLFQRLYMLPEDCL